MNELMVVYSDGWVYFKTSETDVIRARDAYYKALRDAGIDYSNHPVKEMILRDEYYDDIGKLS